MTPSLLPTLDGCGGDSPVAWGAVSAVLIVFFSAFVPVALRKCAPDSPARKFLSFVYVSIVVVVQVVRNGVFAIEDYRYWSTSPNYFHLSECLAQRELVEGSIAGAITMYFSGFTLVTATGEHGHFQLSGYYCSIAFWTSLVVTTCAVAMRVVAIAVLTLAFVWPYAWVAALVAPLVIVAVVLMLGLHDAIKTMYARMYLGLGPPSWNDVDHEYKEQAIWITWTWITVLGVTYAALCGYYYMYGSRSGESYTGAMSVRGGDHVSFQHMRVTDVWTAARVLLLL